MLIVDEEIEVLEKVFAECTLYVWCNVLQLFISDTKNLHSVDGLAPNGDAARNRMASTAQSGKGIQCFVLSDRKSVV